MDYVIGNMNVDIGWSGFGNIFYSYDQPAYIGYKGYPDSLRFMLKVYATINNTQVTFIDDTATNTLRTGSGSVKIWDTNPVSQTPPQSPAVYPITVEVYIIGGLMIQKTTLYFMYVASDRRIFFKDENKNRLVCSVSYAFPYNYNGQNIPFYYINYFDYLPTAPIKKDYAVIEAYHEGDKKYYWISLEGDLPAGDLEVSLKPSDQFIFTITYLVDNGFVNALFGNSVGQFLSNLVLPYIGSYSMYMAKKISSKLGIRAEVVDAKVISTNPITLQVTYLQDIAPATLAIVGAIIVVSIIVYFIVSKIVSVNMVGQIPNITSAAEGYLSQKIDLESKILDYAKSVCGNDASCVQNTVKSLMDSFNPPDQNFTALMALLNNINNANNQADKWKTYAVLAGLGGVLGGAILARGGGSYIVEKLKE